MKKYKLDVDDSNKYGWSIGCNHLATGVKIGGFISSYSNILDALDDNICIENGLGDVRYALVGNMNKVYELLKHVIDNRKPSNFNEICECVSETVNLFFGDFSNVKNRLSFYPSLEDVECDGMKMGCITDLEGKNSATCVERTVLSHNLLKSLEINSTIKIAGFINNDDKNDAHAFNLVENMGKYYIFDSTQPTLINDRINPLVAEIPFEVYNELIIPFNNFGYSVHVKHFNPLMNKEYDVIYDAGREKYYDTCILYKK